MFRLVYGYTQHDETDSTFWAESAEFPTVSACAECVHELCPEQWEVISTVTGEDWSMEVLLYVKHLNAAKRELKAHRKSELRELVNKPIQTRAPERVMSEHREQIRASSRERAQ